MPDIRILDENTVCKIAAGEVILSPAFVVKELVENSIDAGSSEIIVDVRGGGLSRVSVSDDGCGMSRDQIMMALEHHATSKLSDVSDLRRIATYGFRGEALPSIVSVSNSEIISSYDASKPATSVRIDGGIIRSVQPAAANRGTSIIVRNLFYNTPVRRKFLKSENYELALITETVTRYALAHNEIRFALFANEREAFSTSRGSDLKKTVSDIFSREIAASLIEERFEGAVGSCGTVRITALFAPPHVSKPNNRFQYFFVNKRPFRNRALSHALAEPYRNRLNPGKYPVAFIFIEMDQQFVDVNIHPSKTEVAFVCERELHGIIENIVARGLSSPGVMGGQFAGPGREKAFERTDAGAPRKTGTDGERPGQAYRQTAGPSGVASADVGAVSGRTYDFDGDAAATKGDGAGASRAEASKSAQPRERKDAKTPLCDAPSEQFELALGEKNHLLAGLSREHAGHAEEPVSKAEPSSGTASNEGATRPATGRRSFLSGAARIVGQIFNAFILIEDADGLLVIDQHVAAEKVLYEKIYGSLRSREFSSQTLLIPHVYSLSPAEFQTATANHDLFERYGFDVDVFSSNAIAVRAVPDFIEPDAEKDFLFEIVSSGISGKVNYDDDFLKAIAATMSCKGAVKAGKPLNDETIRLMIADLEKCEDPYFCPHGRPVIIKMGLSDILSRFKRTLSK